VNIACTRCTEAIYTRYREEKGCCCCWSCCGRCVEGLKCEQGGRAQEQKYTVEEGCIEGTWCREYKW
jgi:hypothetical protein